jgi:hypothetical protein
LKNGGSDLFASLRVNFNEIVLQYLRVSHGREIVGFPFDEWMETNREEGPEEEHFAKAVVEMLRWPMSLLLSISSSSSSPSLPVLSFGSPPSARLKPRRIVRGVSSPSIALKTK